MSQPPKSTFRDPHLRLKRLRIAARLRSELLKRRDWKRLARTLFIHEHRRRRRA